MEQIPRGRSVTLFIPGFFSAPGRRAPMLEAVLARAQPLVAPPSGLEQRLFHLFDIPIPADADLPIAAVTRLAETGRADEDWWLCADPVYLLVEGAHLILIDRIADLPAAEAQALAQEILAVFGAEGWRLETAPGGHWYLQPGQTPAPQTHPLEAVRGRDVHGFLPGGLEGRRWHGILNEIQMLLHASPVNAAREAHGVSPVNSLWFWGGGRLPAPVQSRWAGLWSGHALSRGLAMRTGSPVADLPVSAVDWLQRASAGEHLLVLDADVLAGDVACKAFEDAWIAPLLKALQARDLSRMVLLGDRGRAFAIEGADLRRWWRRRRPLQHYATHE